MKGLLLKDWYLSLKYYKAYFAIVALVLGAACFTENNVFFLYYPFMLTSLIPIGLQSVDESTKWDAYCGAMPVTRGQAVSEKYLFGLFLSLLVEVLVLAGQSLRMAMTGSFSSLALGNLLVTTLTVFFLLPAISLPMIFKFGAEKGRMAQYVIIGAVCGGAALLMKLEPSGILFLNSLPGLPALIVLAAAAVYILSWRLSIRFYEKRELH